VALQVVEDHCFRAIDLALCPLGALSVSRGFLFAMGGSAMSFGVATAGAVSNGMSGLVIAETMLPP
jgi:hypothetical protein